MAQNRLKNGVLTITAPAWRQYSPRLLTYCPCPPASLPLPTSSDYGLAVYPALLVVKHAYIISVAYKPLYTLLCLLVRLSLILIFHVCKDTIFSAAQWVA